MLSVVGIGPYVWITGYHLKNGVIWIFDKEYKLIDTINTVHNGIIYSANQIGNLLWTYANDKKIITWKTEDFKSLTEYVTIELDHRDSVTCLLLQPCENGHTLWSGSADKTINIHFIPHNYDHHLQPPSKNLPVTNVPPINKRTQLRGHLKRSTTIASSDSRYNSEKDIPATASLILEESVEDTQGGVSTAKEQKQQSTAENRRALFAKGRTPSGNATRGKKIFSSPSTTLHEDPHSLLSPVVSSKDALSKDNTTPLQKSQKSRKSQNHFVTLRRSETSKREKTPSTENSIQ